MKKIITVVIFSLIALNIFSQNKKEISITSNTLKNGGTYTLLKCDLGKILIVKNMEILYKYNSIPYTINDSVSITDTTKQAITDSINFYIKGVNVEDTSLYLMNGNLLLQTQSVLVKPSLNYSIYPSNNFNVYIPNGKLSSGNSNLIINLDYEIR